MDSLYQQGEDALKKGDKNLAQSLFKKAVQQNKEDIQSWLALSDILDTDFEKIQCLQTVLKIEPKNQLALDQLDQILGNIIHKENIGNQISEEKGAVEGDIEDEDLIGINRLRKAHNRNEKKSETHTENKERKKDVSDPLDVFRASFSIDENSFDEIEEKNLENRLKTHFDPNDETEEKEEIENANPTWESTKLNLPEISWTDESEAIEKNEQKYSPMTEPILDKPMGEEISDQSIDRDNIQKEADEKTLSWEETRKLLPEFSWNDEEGEKEESGKTNDTRADEDNLTGKKNKFGLKINPKQKRLLIIGGIGTGLIFIAIISLIFSAGGGLSTSGTQQATFGKPVSFVDITSTITPTKFVFPSPTVSATPTPRQSRTPNPSPTFAVANRTVLAHFGEMQNTISAMRGLLIEDGNIATYPISKAQANDYFNKYISMPEISSSLEKRKKALMILGFVKSNFNMMSEFLNHQVDYIGGFYKPIGNEIFIVSTIGMGGYTDLAYVQEFDQALLNQQFNIKDSGLYPECTFDSQHCRAIEALIKGDATLLAEQWAQQYQNTKDVLEQIYSPTPYYLPEDQELAPYLTQDAIFPYRYGAQFVKYYYQSGNWGSINSIYNRLPASTSQILHPEKYIVNKLPVDVPDDGVESAMGDEWTLIQNDVLGEWMTYLLLAYNSESISQIEAQTAKSAANGWSGDRYLVFENKNSRYTALGAHWLFESPDDADEFFNILNIMLNRRYRGNYMQWQGRICWNANSQVSCEFKSGKQVLWLVGPDKDSINSLISGYTDFSNK